MDAQIRNFQLAPLRERVRCLLRDRSADETWEEEVHDALTVGYAAVHVLEMERLRLTRRLQKMIRAAATPPEAPELLRRRQANSEELEELRALLVRLRRRAIRNGALSAEAHRSPS